MADNVENLILEHLRAIRADIGGIKDDVREIKHRLTSSEAAVASIQRDYAMFDFQAMRFSGNGGQRLQMRHNFGRFQPLCVIGVDKGMGDEAVLLNDIGGGNW